MLESNPPKNEEYRRTPFGRLVRSYELASGVNVQERTDPKSKTKIVTETYGTIHREYRIFGEADDYATLFQQRLRRMQPNSVGFIDEERQSKIVLYSSGPDHININLMDSQEMGGIPPAVAEEEALVSLVYSKDGLHECRVKAEKTQGADTENVGDWVDPLQKLIEYYSGRFSSELEGAGLAHEMSYNEIVEELGSEKQPLVQEANDAALRLIEKALASLPAEDQARARRILEEVYLRERLSRDLLICTKAYGLHSVKEVLSISGGEDDYMNSVISEELDSLFELQMHDYKRVLKINQFDENGFIWEETEIEDQLMHGSKETVMQSGEAPYGSKIAVQDSTFTINKNNSDINVDCLTGNNKLRWTSVFPLMIPFEQIKKLLDDPKEDLRNIRQLSTATLDLQR